MMNLESFSSFMEPSSKILLIEPPFYRFFGYERWHYPVTLTLVGTYLEKLGHSVRIYDADKPTPDCKPLNRFEVSNKYPDYESALYDDNNFIWKEVYDIIKEFNPDVVGLTSITAKIDSANKCARMAKEILGRNVKVVLGGPHVQGMRFSHPDYDFGNNYDFVVERIPNLILFKPNKNLILGRKTYSAKNFSSIMTSTGCPNSCTFCCHSFEKLMIYRDIENVRREVEEIKEWFDGIEAIFIMDDCFFSKRSHFNRVTSLLHEMNFSYTAGSRIMALSPEKIDLFVSRGGIRIFVGVESGSQKVLDRIEKRLKIEEIVKRTQWLNDVGIPWSAFFMVGFPFETIEDLKLTEDLIHRIQPTFVSINKFTPYPGTKIYEEYFLDKQIEFKDLFQLNRHNCIGLTEDLENYIDHMFFTFDEYNQQNALKLS